ncbi:Os09g0263474 [Oryza sativa Japonica Group]|uniref:Os09g0263474 protein n=1 Tax=Oryza sativa subsp. japonica TaxID=39947 RepID=A0A0N7KQG1_ORYSJ|nr:Os09g0263474 [Oryza sativa Japonica Group]
MAKLDEDNQAKLIYFELRKEGARSHPSANLGAQKSAPYDGKLGSKDYLFDDVDTGRRSDKRDAEEYALLNGSSPRSELNHPAALTA